VALEIYHILEAIKEERATLFVETFVFAEIIYNIKKSIQIIKNGSMLSILIQFVYFEIFKNICILVDTKKDIPMPIGIKVTSVQ
jgi:hypothetical protein